MWGGGGVRVCLGRVWIMWVFVGWLCVYVCEGVFLSVYAFHHEAIMPNLVKRTPRPDCITNCFDQRSSMVIRNQPIGIIAKKCVRSSIVANVALENKQLQVYAS